MSAPVIFHIYSAGTERIIWSSEDGFMEDAWEPPGEEGRGQLRKAVGRCQRPTIHGSPNGVTRRPGWPAPACEWIACRGKTRGSEPSKYPQEEKSNEIPPVAASERGGAQTGWSDPCGVVGRRRGDRLEGDASGTAWEGRPERVKAPYAKRDPKAWRRS